MKNGKKNMNDKLKLKGHMKAFMRWPLILSALLIVLNILVYCVSVKAGLVVSAGVLIYVGIAVVVLRCHRPFIVNELIAFANQYDSLEKRILEELALPYAIMDMNGRMIWSNKVFAELTGKDQFYKKNISTIFPDVTADKLPVADKKEISEISTQFGEKIYRVSMQRVELGEIVAGSETLENTDKNVSLIAMYMYDDTELKEYIKKNEDNKLVVALAYLDNYEEALESVEDVRRSLLIALIDRKITKYFSNFDGLVKKIEKDKYFVVFQHKYLAELQSDRFSLIEDVKTVKVGNEMAVTLSIGIGVGGDTYNQNYEYSRMAIDLALGRGGDQVVVKEGENVVYYGGNSKQVEKNTRVKARVKAHALREIIESREHVMIMGHSISDTDAFGAAIGIYCAARVLGKKAQIVLDQVTSSLRPLKEGFTTEKGYPPDMFVSSERALELTDYNTLVMVVDVNRPSHTECPGLLKRTDSIVVFDHHRQSSEVISNPVLSYIEPYASSTCEMVAEVLQYFTENIKLAPHEADCIYAGILIDTSNFMTKTGVRTFEAAAYLKRCGAEVTRVRKMLRNDMDAYKARAEVVRHAEVYRGAFAISICPADKIESPTIVGAQAADELLNIVGIKASFVLTEYQGKIYVSSRSIDEINVQKIMERLGGGGHLNMAGCQLRDCTVSQAQRIIEDTIDEMLEEGDIEE